MPRKPDDNYRRGVKTDRHRHPPLRLASDLHDRLDTLSARTGITDKDLLREAISDLLLKYERQEQGGEDKPRQAS